MAKRNIRAASGKMSFLGSLARRHSGAESKVVLYLEGGKRIIGAVDALSHQGSSGNDFNFTITSEEEGVVSGRIDMRDGRGFLD